MITDKEILQHIDEGDIGSLYDACYLMEMRRQGRTETSQGFSVSNPPVSKEYYEDLAVVDAVRRACDKAKFTLSMSFNQILKQEKQNDENTNSDS